MITEPRIYYKPFEYQDAFDFYKNQHRAHWLADEVPLASDLNDWKLKLDDVLILSDDEVKYWERVNMNPEYMYELANEGWVEYV